jgi:hypothetical protein
MTYLRITRQSAFANLKNDEIIATTTETISVKTGLLFSDGVLNWHGLLDCNLVCLWRRHIAIDLSLSALIS